jgi:hypothetical protein
MRITPHKNGLLEVPNEIFSQLTAAKTGSAQRLWLNKLPAADFDIVVSVYADLLEFDELPREIWENIYKIRDLIDPLNTYHNIFSRSRKR